MSVTGWVSKILNILQDPMTEKDILMLMELVEALDFEALLKEKFPGEKNYPDLDDYEAIQLQLLGFLADEVDLSNENLFSDDSEKKKKSRLDVLIEKNQKQMCADLLLVTSSGMKGWSLGGVDLDVTEGPVGDDLGVMQRVGGVLEDRAKRLIQKSTLADIRRNEARKLQDENDALLKESEEIVMAMGDQLRGFFSEDRRSGVVYVNFFQLIEYLKLVNGDQKKEVDRISECKFVADEKISDVDLRTAKDLYIIRFPLASDQNVLQKYYRDLSEFKEYADNQCLFSVNRWFNEKCRKTYWEFLEEGRLDIPLCGRGDETIKRIRPKLARMPELKNEDSIIRAESLSYMTLQRDVADISYDFNFVDEEIPLLEPQGTPEDDNILAELLRLTEEYAAHLENALVSLPVDSDARRAVEKKLKVLCTLDDCLNMPNRSAAQKIQNFADTLNKPENAAVLGNRRYVSRGLMHLGESFLKGIVLCIPLMIDLTTMGLLGLTEGGLLTRRAIKTLFEVKGQTYEEDVKKITGDKSSGPGLEKK